MFPLHDDNPTTLRPILTIGLIACCVLVFLWQQSLGGSANQAAIFGLGVIPATLLRDAALSPELYVVPPAMTVLTSMFLHGGWMHIIGNLLFLWIFGNNVEDSMGHGRFLVFYLLCGTAAALAQAIPDPSSEIPMIGASGAVSGVLGAYMLLYPRAHVLVLVPLGVLLTTVRWPALWVLGMWFAIQLVSTLVAGGTGGGVAFRAHLGGFVAGMLLIPLFKQPRFRLHSPFSRTRS